MIDRFFPSNYFRANVHNVQSFVRSGLQLTIKCRASGIPIGERADMIVIRIFCPLNRFRRTTTMMFLFSIASIAKCNAGFVHQQSICLFDDDNTSCFVLFSYL